MSSKPMEVKKRRNADYKLLSIVDAFEPELDSNKIKGTRANIQQDVENEINYDDSFCLVVSAPYVLSRLCSLFEGLKIEAYGQSGYKITWEVILKHKKSGNVVTFYDYKGRISYGSNAYKKTDKQFLKDVRKLLDVLSNDRCPHPYDGCVVGEIA